MATPPSPSSSRKPQPRPWTYQETLHLIQSYQEKWYSLRRGQLKSSQWEEVSATVAARCGYDVPDPSKSATQCRHKMEKLRQRYRSEKQHFAINGSSCWEYFDLMELLELGPLPISTRPMTRIGDRVSDEVAQIDDDEDNNSGKSRSINYILRRPAIVNRFSAERNLVGHSRSRKNYKQSAMEKEEEEEREREMRLGLASEIKQFAGRLMGMENMKLEMMRETERWRMKMEKRRNAMIYKSQEKIVESIARAFGSGKRIKIDQ